MAIQSVGVAWNSNAWALLGWANRRHGHVIRRIGKARSAWRRIGKALIAWPGVGKAWRGMGTDERSRGDGLRG